VPLCGSPSKQGLGELGGLFIEGKASLINEINL
jgi:hypothetical protein